MRLNAKQIEAFYRVFISGSFTAAAQELFVSQPAVSRMVADLELAVGFKLFERKNRRVFPTPEGRMLFDEIEKTFVGLEKVSSRAEEIRTLRKGSISIAAMPALSFSILPPLIKDFTGKYPGIHISLNVSNSESVFDWLGSHQMDIGIAALPVHKTVSQIDLLPSPACRCVLPPGSPLAKRDVIEPHDLEDLPFVSLLASSMLGRRIDAVFQAAGIQRQMVLRTPYCLTAIQFANLGMGATIVDPFSARTLAADPHLVKPFEPEIPYEFGLLFPGSSVMSQATEKFVDMLREEVAEV